MGLVLVPTPKGPYYVAAERITWLCSDGLERSTIWVDNDSWHTVLLAVEDLAALLGYTPPAQTRTSL